MIKKENIFSKNVHSYRSSLFKEDLKCPGCKKIIIFMFCVFKVLQCMIKVVQQVKYLESNISTVVGIYKIE